MSVSDDAADCQALALALQHLAASRPGWRNYLREIAGKLHAAELFDRFEKIREADAPAVEQASKSGAGREGSCSPPAASAPD